MNEAKMKNDRRTLVFMCIWYPLLSIVALLFSIGLFDTFVTENWGSHVYSTIMFRFITALIPTVLLYFALQAPYELPRKLRVVLVLIWAAATIYYGVIFFSICKRYQDILSQSSETFDEAFMFPFTFVVGVIGFIALHILLKLHIDPAALQKTEAEDLDDDGWKGFVTKNIFIPLLNLMKTILRFKEKHKNLFLIFGTILLTALLMPFAMVVVVIVVLLIVSTLIGLFTEMYAVGNTTTHATYSVNDGGFTRTLTYYDYDTLSGCDRYQDDLGHYWLTKDNGATFTKE